MLDPDPDQINADPQPDLYSISPQGHPAKNKAIVNRLNLFNSAHTSANNKAHCRKIDALNIATSFFEEQRRLFVKVSSILYDIDLRQMAASSQLEGVRTGSGQAPSSSKTMAPTCAEYFY
jgi:hypothetical protein